MAGNDSRLTNARTPTAHSHTWGEVTGKPTTFAPSPHQHSISQVTGLQDALDNAGGGSNVEVMTRSEFDGITPDPSVWYIVMKD